MRTLMLLSLFVLAVPDVSAQRFILADTLISSGVPRASWGDYDADGDMDLLLSGQKTLTVYRSEGDASCPSPSTTPTTTSRSARPGRGRTWMRTAGSNS
ncbi:MAG TPA: VCBS repeat-containing protein [Rhodothermales bacterium]|nr:VCBS repeat-containing protein [Rhodothermales bacterium]